MMGGVRHQAMGCRTSASAPGASRDHNVHRRPLLVPVPATRVYVVRAPSQERPSCATVRTATRATCAMKVKEGKREENEGGGVRERERDTNEINKDGDIEREIQKEIEMEEKIEWERQRETYKKEREK